MMCYIYKPENRADTYLYIQQKDEFTQVPDKLLDMLGKLIFVMDLEITTDTSLARADSEDVLQQLKQNGFYLQMPPKAVLF